ncbi:uncharacterized protein [Leptinotarsa decemlineata]|uniref:uncharacterized protein n=1 Tax=Leptinotarsa decemlineata TaxID=7539 RepID=UPI003D30BC17
MIHKKFLVLMNIFFIVTGRNGHHLSKRYLLFTRSTQVQFSVGISFPLVLPRRSINFSLVTQATYLLPYNISNFQPITISARDREKSSVFDISRNKFYEYIIDFLDSFGLDGKQCLLRSICEISEIPMNIKDEETLLEKIVHFVFTPSLETTWNETEKIKKKFFQKLLLAEKIGREDGDCSDIYSDCVVSLVDLFTAKYTI